MLSGLYVLTDSQHYAHNAWLDRIEKIILGGASVIQLREKLLDDSELVSYASDILDLCIFYNVPFIVNDRVELAKKIQADGVHLGREDLSISQARDYLGKHYLIGQSCYASMQHAIKAEKKGVDYVAFGSVFTSKTKPNATRCNLSTLKLAKRLLKIPICAIGGINLKNTQSIIQMDVDLIAVTEAVFNADNPRQAANQITQKYIIAKLTRNKYSQTRTDHGIDARLI